MSFYNAVIILNLALGKKPKSKHSGHDRKAVANVAWSSPGVTIVDDRIAIEYD